VIDLATNTLLNLNGKTSIEAGETPRAIAITPDGKRAYVANTFAESVSVLDLTNNRLLEVNGKKSIDLRPSPLDFKRPSAIAITPDGKRAYVANYYDDTVSVIDTATNTVLDLNGIKVGEGPKAITITPDGERAYVANRSDHTVSVIDTATNSVVKTINGMGGLPGALAISPDGKRVYVNVAMNAFSSHLAAIDTATDTVLDLNGNGGIDIGAGIRELAIAPDGKHAYVTQINSFLPPSDSIVVVDLTTNTVTSRIDGTKADEFPRVMAFPPNQSPIGAIAVKAPRLRPGIPASFDASASTDPDGQIASYAWSFGDGSGAAPNTTIASHAFARPGTYEVTLTVTDEEGCAGLVFTGQTAYCSGSPTVKNVEVAYPGVRVRCPKRAKPRGCSFKLRAVAGKGRKAKPTSALARARVRSGRTAIVSLRPTKEAARKLAAAKRILVKQTIIVAGKAKTRIVSLRVVR
jgi:YVTN family beta-propeller protein